MTGEQITQLRAQLGLSMSELSARLAVDVNLVVDWEAEQRFPTKRHHEQLLKLSQGRRTDA